MLSRIQLFCNSMNCRLPGLQWVAISFSRGSSQLRDQTCIFCISRWSLYHWAIREACMNYAAAAAAAKSLQSRPTLCDPTSCSLLRSSVHGIFQPRELEWIAISFSRGSSQPRDRTQVSCTADRRFIVWATREAVCSSTNVHLNAWCYVHTERLLYFP